MNTVVNSIGLHVLMNGQYQTAVEQVALALRATGFEIAAEIMLEQILEKKADSSISPYEILVVCHPDLTRRALLIEPKIGALLLCNVSVSQMPGDQVEVVITDPLTIGHIETEPHLKPIAVEIHTRLERVADVLKG